MARTGVCCASLEDPRALMKMGLSMVLVGHVNFMLGALVHGVVLRHINLHKQARAMEYAISNVVAFTSGLMGVVVGILAIVQSKNKGRRSLTWSLFIMSLASSLMAAAAAVGLLVSVVRAIIHGGRSLLTHCRFPDAIGYSSITNECPFDPTRIYSTTLILWVPLIVTCIVQLIFCARCLSVCVSFLGLPCCCYLQRKRPREARAIRVARPLEELAASRVTKPRHHSETPTNRYTETPRSSSEPRRQVSQQVRQQRPQRPPTQYRSLPPTQRQPPRQQPSRQRPQTPHQGQGIQQRPPEQHHLLERGTLDRSSFWI
ncbi:transmembrane protein 54-like [Nerophis lumbriciformis]|uniref:transmembrane protein 54-like n=1 Tax=Nerophis lumbriciformis TaxID=546530 RepID=UPI002AE04A69|nr:transmembrane protein 54-like [Nerophis lumbriciformis]XP_061787561.1 transmembrane protein 54-like [Nerophis lumbriciformis]